MRKTSQRLQQIYRQETKQFDQEQDTSEQCLELALWAHLKDTATVGEQRWGVDSGLWPTCPLHWSPNSEK